MPAGVSARVRSSRGLRQCRVNPPARVLLLLGRRDPLVLPLTGLGVEPLREERALGGLDGG